MDKIRIKIIEIISSDNYDSYSGDDRHYYPTVWDEVTPEEYECLVLWVNKQKYTYNSHYKLIREIPLQQHLPKALSDYLELARKAKIQAEKDKKAAVEKAKLKEEKKKEKDLKKLQALKKQFGEL